MIDDQVPPLAYRYKPTDDYLFIGENKQIRRSIYYKTQFTEFEKKEIAEFKNFIVLKLPSKTIPDFFGDEEILRVLLKHRFSQKKALNGLIEEIEWRSSVLPNSYQSLGLHVQSLLNEGIIYIPGRDNRFRPLLVIDTEKLDHYKSQIEKVTYLLVFFIEYIRTRLSLPGKIENFILLVDLSHRKTKDAPVKELKKLYEIIQLHYPYYMSLNYIVNSGGKSMFGKFTDSDTEKITIWDEGNGGEYFLIHFNPAQLEKKYGGQLENLLEYWPVILPTGPFNASGDLEDKFLVLYEESEGELHSISEKVSISLPFTKDDIFLSESESLKFDSNSYNVNVDLPVSMEVPDIQGLSQINQDFVIEDRKKSKKKICCNFNSCVIN